MKNRVFEISIARTEEKVFVRSSSFSALMVVLSSVQALVTDAREVTDQTNLNPESLPVSSLEIQQKIASVWYISTSEKDKPLYHRAFNA